MTALPTGTVTLLFSDMEGSTRLLTRLGDRYVDALDAQRAIMPAYDQARARLAEAEWVALYAEGRATPLEEALAAAVHEPSSIPTRSTGGSA